MYVPGGSRVERLHALRRGRDGVRNAASFTRHKTMDGAVTLVACCHAGPKGRGFTMRILLALAAIGCPLFTLNAQDTPLVRPGTRLRVTAESSLLQLPTGTYRVLEDTTLVLSTGLYRQLTGATLILTHGSATLRFPVASIALVERSHGRRTSVTGGVVGFLLGGVVGTALSCLANRDDYGVPCAGDSDTKFILGVSLGAAAGALLGSLGFGKEQWHVVDVNQLVAHDP